MEFDWSNRPFELGELSQKAIEESFEDPFSLRLMPEIPNYGEETRFFLLGKSLNGQNIFSVFWTDGKKYRVICSRPMTEAESDFYTRKNSELYF
jgi:uncharacterized DUF497 family protein